MNENIMMSDIQKNARPYGTVLNERHVIKGVIGSGGFSVVYDAVDTNNNQRVAIKECTNREIKEKFISEAHLLASFFDDNNIVSVIDFFEDGGSAFIVMEYLEGKTLREDVQQNGKWSMERAYTLFAPVMLSVERINKRGIIHRDISPDNLILTERSGIKLLDFGAAREFENSNVSRLVYKPSYSSPEQMDEKGNMGAWSDVYAICATIYFCITGKNPEDAISRLLFDELHTPSAEHADISPEAESVLMKGLELDHTCRIQNAGALREDFNNIFN